jgi:AraC-like DNA-binding protein
MATVATLLPEPIHLQRITRALANRHTLVACSDWQELTRACETGAVHMLVVDLYASGNDGFDRLRVLRGQFPRLALVAYIPLLPRRAQDLFDAGRFGLEAVVIADEDDSEARILEIIERADARTVAALLRRSLPPVHGNVRDAILLAVTRATENLSPAALARTLGVSRRTLSQRLAHDDFPAPRVLLTWGRLLVAARLLEDERRSADAIALTLHFPSGSALRNACQRYLQATPSEIRARGGATYVLRVFLRRRASDSTAVREPGRRLQIAI